MGTKPAIRRHRCFIYAACSIIIGLFFPGCTITSMVRPFTVSADTGQQQYVNQITASARENDFQSAEKKTRQMLETLKNRFHAGDQVLSNYILQARLNQLLITRIISEQGRQQTLDTQVQACSKQQDANQQQIESLKTKADTLAKKLAAVKKENILLKDQINRIKQIDLNTKTTH